MPEEKAEMGIKRKQNTAYIDICMTGIHAMGNKMS